MLGTQPGDWEDGPVLFVGVADFKFGGAVELERLGRGDGSDEILQIIIMLDEVVGQQSQCRWDIAGRRHAVNRLGKRFAEKERPRAVHDGTGEIRIAAIRNPLGQVETAGSFLAA